MGERITHANTVRAMNLALCPRATITKGDTGAPFGSYQKLYSELHMHVPELRLRIRQMTTIRL